jgi:hypothetical protein
MCKYANDGSEEKTICEKLEAKLVKDNRKIVKIVRIAVV